MGAAFICLANATEEAKVAEKAFNALKAIQGDLFTVTDTNAYNQKDNDGKEEVREAFANKFGLGEDDKKELMKGIEDHPNLIKDLIDAAKVTDAEDLKTKMNGNEKLKTVLELIAKTDSSSASAIGMSGLLSFPSLCFTKRMSSNFS